MERLLTGNEKKIVTFIKTTYQSNPKSAGKKASFGLKVTIAEQPCGFVVINSDILAKFKYDYVLSGGKVSSSISEKK